MVPYIRPRTRAESFADSLWPMCEPDVEVGDVRALVVCCDLECATRAGGGLLEDDRDVCLGQPLVSSTRAVLELSS